ncbi:MAG: hypothetical protein H7X97_11510 [Opitutaceae bacterium]|nr:hypothetical protein [Verrucomicrobiales bacterium]
MQGEFNGDFTRDTHHPLKRFSRVLMQQGRVLLDADWNEQTSIVLHYLRSLAADLIGPHGGPPGQFEIKAPIGSTDFAISEGRYYVNGLLCENRKRLDTTGVATEFTYFNQPHYPFAEGTKELSKDKGRFLAYLDVWERHITFLADEDPKHDEPSIREVALGGPDTASRAQVVWQVRLLDLEGRTESDTDLAKVLADFKEFQTLLMKKGLLRPGTGKLSARARKPRTEGDDCACVTSPESRYRGVENQLYRVEIHKPGVAGVATFKWSRENGSVVFRIRKPIDTSDAETTTVALSDLGRDARFGLKKGDWVEIVDDDYILMQNQSEPLLKVHTINHDERTVTLCGVPGNNMGRNLEKHPLLRRWDHRGDSQSGGLTINKEDGAAFVQSGPGEKGWLHLEDGVEIQFSLPDKATYQTGDYWLIPARVATGNVEWPGSKEHPEPLPPHGIEHHYAPLAVLPEIVDRKITKDIVSLRKPISI